MILSNVNIGTGPSAGDGDPLRSAFTIINNNFQTIENNVNALTNSVNSVAGRTGNVILTVNDIVGLSNAYAISSATTTANTGMKGYVDQANSIQSAQIATANIGLKGYIDQANTIQSAQIATANLGIIGYVDLANTIQSGQVGAANLAIIAANLGMKGYVDSVATLSIYSNVNAKAYTESMGYQNFGNVNVAAYVTTANSAILGYIDLANTIQSAQVGAANLAITAANLGMKGYVDSVASLSIYGNSNVKSYLTGGFDGNIVPSANITYSLGSPTQQWKDLYVSNNTIFIGGTPLSSTPGGLTFAGVPVSSFAPTSATTVTPGTVWNYGNTGRAVGLTSGSLYQAAYGAGKFIIVENTLYGAEYFANTGLYSSDGVTWSTMYMPNVAAGTSRGATIYGGDKFVSMYVGHGNIATSTDGITWTFNQNAIPPGEGGGFPYEFYKGLLAYGNGRFVALTGYTTRRSVISLDGITWSNGSMSTTSIPDDLPAIDRQGQSLLYKSLAFTDGVFVASAGRVNGSGGNLIAYSTDGVSWGNIQ